MTDQQIIVKAMCLFLHDDKLLLSRHLRAKTEELYYRPLGGGMEFQEASEETIRREIKEELGTEITQLAFVDVLENIFEYKGVPAHQIIFIYRAELVDQQLYRTNPIPFIEADLSEHQAEWISRKDIKAKQLMLVPKGIQACIQKAYD